MLSIYYVNTRFYYVNARVNRLVSARLGGVFTQPPFDDVVGGDLDLVDDPRVLERVQRVVQSVPEIIAPSVPSRNLDQLVKRGCATGAAAMTGHVHVQHLGHVRGQRQVFLEIDPGQLLEQAFRVSFS